MEQPWLHRSAVLLAVCTLILLVTGAVVTSNEPAAPPSLELFHRVVAGCTGLLTLGLVLWLARASSDVPARRIGWIALAAVLMQAVLGGNTPAVSILHAFAAQLFFGITVALAVLTSPGWQRSPDVVADRGHLRALSAVTLALLVVQVALGAAVRHGAISATIHIVVAFVVTLLILIVCIMITNGYPEHRMLPSTAKLLMGLTFAQVMLGMGAFITRLMMAERSLAVQIPSVIHVGTGALTFGCTVVLFLQIRRNVMDAAAQQAVAPSA